MLRRVSIDQVKANVIDAVDSVTLDQSRSIVDDVKVNGLSGFIKHSLRLNDLR